MRPARLELEGFGPYRLPTVVDFEGVDLFAFTGPTGSGKTSIIDGIVFALYGCVPRYDDKRVVAAAISQNATEAKVRFDFAIDGLDYSAVRIVRRTKQGASTKEARLERADGTVLAGSADEVAGVVEALLGLSYEHFVKCVVLPQGDFARFLHDKPERRQDLLVELLDLGLYERMGRLARTRADHAKGQIEMADARLADLAAVTPDARELLVATATQLRTQLAAIDRELPRLDEFEASALAAEEAARRARTHASILRTIAIPDDVAALVDLVKTAEAAVAETAEAVTTCEAATLVGERDLAQLPDRSALELARAAHEEREKLTAQLDKGARTLEASRAAETVAAKASTAADAALAGAVAALERAQAEHRAHAVMADLVAGEPCPVCRQVVYEVPSAAAPADLSRATRARTDAQADADATRTRLHDAQTERVRVETKLAMVSQQLEVLAGAVAEHPDVSVVDAQLAQIAVATEAVEMARADEKKARRALTTATAALNEARARQTDARRRFDDVRDTVVELGPPPRSDDDLAADWFGLAAWAETEAAAHDVLAAAADKQQAEASSRRAELVDTWRAQCAALDITVPADDPRSARDALLNAAARADAAVEQIDRDLTEVERLRANVDDWKAARDVAELLGRHLGAKHFEKWVLDEAVQLLASGASAILLDLSRGQYAMAVDPKSGNFTVIDHRDADLVRSARSLSGGETFLASLALALALADQLALLAARGGARLESIFLDEGFGTLDADTLETVATTIEELGARGRMVGLVSHVPDLAARVPVRYEVTKVGNASRVERVDA